MRETSAAVRRDAAALRERARAVREDAVVRRFQPTPLHVLLDEPPDSGLDLLEDALGVPWYVAARVADAFAQAIRQAERGQIADGYQTLAREARRDYSCGSPDVQWQASLLALWEKALDSYYALYGVRC